MNSFAEYVRHGFVLCPIAPGSKAPTGKRWNSRGNAATAEQAATLQSAGLMHSYSLTCAIDIDNVKVAGEWLAARGVDLKALWSGAAVGISSGRLNRAKLLYRLAEPLQSVKRAEFIGDDGKKYTAIDFRCATRDGLSMQDVLPPSVHPDTGKPYEWKYADEMVGDWRNLPEIPASLLVVWKAELRALQIEAAEASSAPVSAERVELLKLLDSQDPGQTYNDWIKVGMSVHSATRGSSEGLMLWDAWSAKSDKYKGLGDLEAHWRSFVHDEKNGITVNTLRREEVAKPEEFPEAPEVEQVEGVGPFTQTREFLENRLAFVKTQDRYFDLADRCLLASDRAIRHILCPQMPFVPNDKGMPERADPLAWLQNSKTKKIVRAVGLHPGKDLFYSEHGEDYVNMFTPVTIKPEAPLPHEREAFEFMWNRLKEIKFRKWLMQFYAHAVQRPGIKIQTAPLLFSEATGSGKNTIAKKVPELLFGKRWVRVMTGDLLGSTFTDILGETWWLYLDELRSGSNKAERAQIANKIKYWVTDEMLAVHPKGLKPFDIPNRLQITATSNFADALQLDDNDRRWAICEMMDSLSEKEAVDLYAFLNSSRAPGVMRHIFKGVNLSGFNPAARAPESAAKTAMIRAGVGDWESTLLTEMANMRGPFSRDLFKLDDLMAHLRFASAKGPSSVHALGKILRAKPFSLSCDTIRGTEKYWCWRRRVWWLKASATERKEHYDDGVLPANIPNDPLPQYVRELDADSLGSACDSLLQ